MLGHHLAQGVDLRVQCADQSDLAGDDGCECSLHGRRLTQRWCPQNGLDLQRLALHITTVRLAQRRADPCRGQSRRTVWIRRGSQYRERVGRIEIVEGV